MLTPQKYYRLPWSLTDNGISWLEVTTSCNLACTGCYRPQTEGHKTLQEIAEDLAVFKRERRSDCMSIAGGDPLVHPKIVDIVRMVKEGGWKPIINTNGLALSRKRLKELKQAGVFGFTFHIDTSQVRRDSEAVVESDHNRVAPQIRADAGRRGRTHLLVQSDGDERNARPGARHRAMGAAPSRHREYRGVHPLPGTPADGRFRLLCQRPTGESAADLRRIRGVGRNQVAEGSRRRREDPRGRSGVRAERVSQRHHRCEQREVAHRIADRQSHAGVRVRDAPVHGTGPDREPSAAQEVAELLEPEDAGLRARGDAGVLAVRRRHVETGAQLPEIGSQEAARRLRQGVRADAHDHSTRRRDGARWIQHVRRLPGHDRLQGTGCTGAAGSRK